MEEQRAAQISIMARERVDAKRNTKQQMLQEGESVEEVVGGDNNN